MFDFISLRTNAIDGINALLSRLDPLPPLAKRASLIDQAIHKFHTIAVAGLLVDASPSKFFLNLARAGSNRAHLLELCVQEGGHGVISSKLPAFWGSVAAREDAVAARIARAGLAMMQVDGEYEDEYRLARLCYTYALQESSDRVAIKDAALELENVGTGVFVDRIPLVSALLDRDESAFVQAFEVLARAHEDEVERDAASFSTPHSTFAPYRFIWLEGLAWIRWAETSGIEVRADILYCPRIARLPVATPYDGDWVLPLAEGE